MSEKCSNAEAMACIAPQCIGKMRLYNGAVMLMLGAHSLGFKV